MERISSRLQKDGAFQAETRTSLTAPGMTLSIKQTRGEDREDGVRPQEMDVNIAVRGNAAFRQRIWKRARGWSAQGGEFVVRVHPDPVCPQNMLEHFHLELKIECRVLGLSRLGSRAGAQY